MVASARVAYLARRGEDYGVKTGAVRVDQALVRKRKQTIVASFRGSGQRKLERAPNVSLIFGEARFVGPKEIAVGDRRLGAETIVVNTGARPTWPNLPGLDQVAALDSTSVMELDVVPEHLIILGGGYIGLEFAHMFLRFGAAVSVIERGPRLLAREDPEIGEALSQILVQDGLKLLADTAVVRVEPAGKGVAVVVRDPGGERTVSGSHLLVAIGRSPNTDRLGLDSAGLELDERGYLKVNDRLMTNVPGVYAAGDVNGGPAFTHVSYDDYRILRDNLIHGKDRTTRGRVVPYTVFTDPELAHVGLSETQAKASGRPFQVARMPMSHVARALEMDEARGLMKSIIDPETRQILGFTVVGVGGGELMAVVQVAMAGRVPYDAIREMIFVHPIMAECLNNLYATLS
jgi:pyruvate/2-oxoglutarate dehydrogenase complex dihydrolipoamide dehydrogenase (E3) component